MDCYAGNPNTLGRRAQGTKALPTATASGNILFRMSGRGYYTGSWQANNSAAIDIIAAEAFADSATLGAYIAFSTRATGGGTPALTERLRISSLGSLLINGDEGSGTSGKLSITNSVSTGAGSALLGTNSPAGTLAAPFTWLVFYSGTTKVYVPAWT